MILDIWDESLCSVEEEYSAETSSKTVNETSQFKNSLISNKGEISTAREIITADSNSTNSKFLVSKYKSRAKSFNKKIEEELVITATINNRIGREDHYIRNQFSMPQNMGNKDQS